MTSLSQKLLAIYPDLQLDGAVLLESDGIHEFIVAWNDPRPQPTPAELVAAELPAARMHKLRELAMARWTAECAGCDWTGPDSVVYRVDSDPMSYGKFAGAVMAAQLGLWSGEWKCRNGRTPALSAEQLIAMASTVFAYVRGCYNRETALAALVDSATTVAAVEAITWETPVNAD